MRACVVVLAVTAFAQPALARDHSHGSSHQVTRHHHAVHSRTPHHRAVRVARWRGETPIESGYAMPKTFEEASNPPPRQRAQQPMRHQFAGFAPEAPARSIARRLAPRDGALDATIARHAAANGLPAALVHRVVIRESRYNARARGAGGALGLMQIKHATARGMGYAGPASGLLDPETNLAYAVRYLAGAYRAAGGNPSRAIAYYASGYHGRGVAVAPRVPRVMMAKAAPVSLRDDSMVIREYVPRKRGPRR